MIIIISLIVIGGGVLTWGLLTNWGKKKSQHQRDLAAAAAAAKLTKAAAAAAKAKAKKAAAAAKAAQEATAKLADESSDKAEAKAAQAAAAKAVDTADAADAAADAVEKDAEDAEEATGKADKSGGGSDDSATPATPKPTTPATPTPKPEPDTTCKYKDAYGKASDKNHYRTQHCGYWSVQKNNEKAEHKAPFCYSKQHNKKIKCDSTSLKNASVPNNYIKELGCEGKLFKRYDDISQDEIACKRDQGPAFYPSTSTSELKERKACSSNDQCKTNEQCWEGKCQTGIPGFPPFNQQKMNDYWNTKGSCLDNPGRTSVNSDTKCYNDHTRKSCWSWKNNKNLKITNFDNNNVDPDMLDKNDILSIFSIHACQNRGFRKSKGKYYTQ